MMDNTMLVEQLYLQTTDEERPTVIDVRSPDQYQQGHIPGAINVPPDRLSSALTEFTPDGPIVVYCDMHSPGSSKSEGVAQMLRNRGYTTFVLEGGLPAWQKAGLPIETEGQGHTLQT